jgi:hypothetical protein
MGKVQRLAGVEIRVIESLQRSLKPSVSFALGVDYVNASIKPATYSSADQFKRDFAYISLLRKWKGWDVGINREWAAFATWREAEKRCFRTNRRLELEASTGCYSVASDFISKVQRKIARILGPLDIDRISELCRFGGGATYDKPRGTTHAEKSCKPTVTFDALPWICRVLAHDDLLGTLVGRFVDLHIVEANRMVMVPKSAKTDRPIAAEPTLNSFIQQGAGRFIRSRLMRAGVNLNDQTINQVLARLAFDQRLATIDLSSASDTLCTNLVKLLLPREWFEFLDAIRCKFTEFKGKRFVLSKFSSMGNAFTFELESLIFHALISEACSGVTSVYGDDLIIPSDDYAFVLAILDWAGFIPNEDKSYGADSNFYESCGVHYFDRVDVTPCFQKDVCRTAHDMVRFANRLVRAGIRLGLREEFNAASQIVRDEARRVFGKQCPGVGPLVEYDEYFIKEDYVWAKPFDDRVRIMSAVTSTPILVYDEGLVADRAYYARKLRCSGFLNPDRKGRASDSLKPKLKCKLKYHWRSASSGLP